MSPYQEAKRQKKAYIYLRVDMRTADPKGGALLMEGPATPKEAREVAKLIGSLASGKTRKNAWSRSSGS